jgi:hypothetical protein
LEELQALHAAFIETFNTTRHWARQEREDGRRTPVEVLEWVRGRPVERATLRRLFGEVQFLRTVNRDGFVRVQRFYIYAEPGLSRRRVSIWVYEGDLRIEYQETLLARYRCVYSQRRRRLQQSVILPSMRRHSRPPNWSYSNSMIRSGSKCSSVCGPAGHAQGSRSSSNSPYSAWRVWR